MTMTRDEALASRAASARRAYRRQRGLPEDAVLRLPKDESIAKRKAAKNAYSKRRYRLKRGLPPDADLKKPNREEKEKAAREERKRKAKIEAERAKRRAEIEAAKAERAARLAAEEAARKAAKEQPKPFQLRKIGGILARTVWR